MPSPWANIALWSLLPLVVVPIILIGRLLPNGAITVASGAAVIALSVFFTFLNGGYGFMAQEPLASIIVWLLALILLGVAFALAVADAAQGRRWRWLLPLIVATYLSFGALLALSMSPDPCVKEFLPTVGLGAFLCGQPVQILHPLTLVGCYIGALTTLLYSLRDTFPGHSAS